MQILNLDPFVQPKRQLTLAGVSYPVNEISVQQFIDNIKAVEKLEEARKAGAADLPAYMELTISEISGVIPTFPVEKLRTLSVEVISKIAEFVRGDLDPKAAAQGAPAADGASTPSTEEGDPAKKS